MQRLRLDKRLVRRRGWISPEELRRELAALPDVSKKIAEPASEPEDEGSDESESQPPRRRPRASADACWRAP